MLSYSLTYLLRSRSNVATEELWDVWYYQHKCSISQNCGADHAFQAGGCIAEAFAALATYS